MVQPSHAIFEDGCAALGPSRLFPGSSGFDETYTLEEFEATQGAFPTINAPCYGGRCPDCGAVSRHADSVMIAVDGACRGNGQPGAVAACAVFFALGSSYNEEHISSEDNPRPTSQRAELMGGIKALEAARRLAMPKGALEGLKQVVIKADSEYLVRGASEWVLKWRNNGWRNARGKPVVNRELFQRLDDCIRELEDMGILVEFWLVPRWQNREADAAANKALDKNIQSTRLEVARMLPTSFVVPLRGKEENDKKREMAGGRDGERKREEGKKKEGKKKEGKKEGEKKEVINIQCPDSDSYGDYESEQRIEDYDTDEEDALEHALPVLLENSSSWGEFFARQAAFREMLDEADDMLEEDAENVPEASVSRPTVLLLSLDSQPWFDDMYGGLINSLCDQARVQRANKAGAASNYLSSNRPDTILVTDAGITERECRTVLEKLKDYVSNGGTAIFCGLFSSFIRPSDLDSFFRTHFGLPWKTGSYCRTTFRLNGPAAANLPPTVRLAPVYSQKALHLKNVEHAAALYLPDDGAKSESHVFPAMEIEDRTQTPAAWARVGHGRVGYVGDVNAEEATDLVILAMCGL